MIVCWLGGYIVVCCLFELGFCGLLVNSVVFTARILFIIVVMFACLLTMG